MNEIVNETFYIKKNTIFIKKYANKTLIIFCCSLYDYFSLMVEEFFKKLLSENNH